MTRTGRPRNRSSAIGYLDVVVKMGLEIALRAPLIESIGVVDRLPMQEG
jgi:hypothetical protein